MVDAVIVSTARNRSRQIVARRIQHDARAQRLAVMSSSMPSSVAQLDPAEVDDVLMG